MQGLDVSVVMTTGGASRLLAQSLAHLEVQSYPAGRFEVIVVCHEAPEVLAGLERFTHGSPVPTRTVLAPGPRWAHALNAGVAAAKGRWVLFLDDDLLAGPGLIAAHVRTQESHGGRCAVVGPVQLHPHVDPGIFTKWEVLCEPESQRLESDRSWDAWHAWNLSLPREVLAAAGPFDDADSIDAVTDLEFASRLARDGLTGFAASIDGTAFGLRPTTLDHERIRHYHLGYATYALLSRVSMPQLRMSILGPMPRGAMAAARLEISMWERVVESLGTDTMRYRRLMRRILHFRAHQGYDDAHAGRPRREFPAPQVLPTPLAPGEIEALQADDRPL